MVCDGIEIVNNTISGLMRYPLDCNYYFYLEIMGGLWLILSFLIYYYDSERKVDPDWISVLSISSIATIVIALAGTYLNLITSDIMVYIFAWCMIWIMVWMFKR